MKKESILYGAIGLLTGIVIMGFTANIAVNNNHSGLLKILGINHSDNSMTDMASTLKNKTGDDFDKAFISEMIVHHKNAISMANLAKDNAKHDEIKNLANEILAAQSKEIDTMLSLQMQWGYMPMSSSEPSDMNGMSH